MSIINLSQLTQLKSQSEGNFFNPNQANIFIELQQQLQLIIQQKRLGLPVEPLLDNNPLICNWINQLETIFPNLFQPRKKLFLDFPLKGKLNLDNNKQVWIEANVNVGIAKGKICLFDCSVREPVITWQDQVKLWVSQQYFRTHPHQIKMIIFVLHTNLHTNQGIQKIIINWNTKKQKETENLLINLITKPIKPPQVIKSPHILPNLDEIQEIPIT